MYDVCFSWDKIAVNIHSICIFFSSAFLYIILTLSIQVHHGEYALYSWLDSGKPVCMLDHCLLSYPTYSYRNLLALAFNGFCLVLCYFLRTIYVWMRGHYNWKSSCPGFLILSLVGIGLAKISTAKNWNKVRELIWKTFVGKQRTIRHLCFVFVVSWDDKIRFRSLIC